MDMLDKEMVHVEKEQRKIYQDSIVLLSTVNNFFFKYHFFCGVFHVRLLNHYLTLGNRNCRKQNCGSGPVCTCWWPEMSQLLVPALPFIRTSEGHFRDQGEMTVWQTAPRACNSSPFVANPVAI